MQIYFQATKYFKRKWGILHLYEIIYNIGTSCDSSPLHSIVLQTIKVSTWNSISLYHLWVATGLILKCFLLTIMFTTVNNSIEVILGVPFFKSMASVMIERIILNKCLPHNLVSIRLRVTKSLNFFFIIWILQITSLPSFIQEVRCGGRVSKNKRPQTKPLTSQRAKSQQARFHNYRFVWIQLLLPPLGPIQLTLCQQKDSDWL